MTLTEETLQRIAQSPVLLVACDYDGTLAPIVENPAAAAPRVESIVALRLLAELPQTHVAVVSGRALRDLRAIAGLPEEVHLVGSHGSEFDQDFSHTLSEEVCELRRRIALSLASIPDEFPGVELEAKPASVAVHYRKANPDLADGILARVREVVGELSGVHTRHGKCVVELAAMHTSKGRALDALRRRVGASAVLFLGDDATDEDAFVTLTGPDVGVKVGEGASAATHRVANTEDVARLLARLAEHRSAWLEGAGTTPIETHGMLSDQRAVALVRPDARIVWYCAPRIDSPALFAEMLGGPGDGYFAITPLGDGVGPAVQRYHDGTMVLETAWPSCRVEDFLDVSEGRTDQRAGRSDLLRIVTGRGRVRVEFAPRIDFGRVATQIRVNDHGVRVYGTSDPIVLRAPGVTWTIREECGHDIASAEVDLDPEVPLVLELRYGTTSLAEAKRPAAERMARTARYWTEWVDTLTLPSIATDAVRRSALVLKALCYGPSGAISAAATTSLPEHLGGVRNWDYRYCWLRDGAMSAAALVDLGSHHEAFDFLGWVLGILDDLDQAPERLRPLYTVLGRELSPEGEIAQLAGYGGSRPVRVGNGAAGQIQIDVFGPIVEVVHRLVAHHAPVTHEHWILVQKMVQAVDRRWREPDHGIWEIRKPCRHHVHTKVMCWVTVDRAIAIGEQIHAEVPEAWHTLRHEIHEEVVSRGWHPDARAFTAAFEARDLDAAALTVGLTGLLPAGDPRVVSTVAVVERHLRDGPTVYRYREDDGLPGIEGGFHLCTSWLVESYLLIGRLDEARALFQSFLGLAGPQGLLSEEYDPRTDRALGNHPQAYSHIGLIRNALALEAAMGQSRRRAS